MKVFANSPWFDFEFKEDVDGFSDLAVYSFSGEECVNKPYNFQIELISKTNNLDITQALGKKARLSIHDTSGGTRLVHGIVSQMDQLHTGNVFTHYVCEIVPRFNFLKYNVEHRIFQNQSVDDIIYNILKNQVFIFESFDFKLRHKYPKREYCVQYGESDFHFINRLCEEEGIIYYFTHDDEKHTIIFTDAPGGEPIPGQNKIRFFPGSGNNADTATVSKLKLRHKINSDNATYKEWNFTQPGIELTSNEIELDTQKAPVPNALRLETYQFPHLYQSQDEGQRYAKLQLLRQLTFRQWIECEADVSRFIPGHSFTLYEHQRDDINREWWLVEVEHQGEQPQVLQHEAPDRGFSYRAKAKALPSDTRFVPEIIHKKLKIEGLQSAIVTGPKGEEIYVDKYGRVKVQFHWDRLGKMDEHSTCWIRVADSWAGINFGFIQAPRIGQEVIVEFMEGDPDRPVITGRTYNEASLPPWQLPEQKALSGIQSREIHADQRNQLVFDDTQGQVQAQLSSDHQLSQLNLGYLTRLNHIQGRNDFRGEGFELRTDGWGAVRAAQGLLISTDKRHNAESHHKDLKETNEVLGRAVDQHKRQSDQALHHKAQPEEPKEYMPTLESQLQDISGPGTEQQELAASHIVLSSPDGVALTSPQSGHMAFGQNFAVTTDKHTTVAAGESFTVAAQRRAAIYSHMDGINLFAGHGLVDIQAQSDALNLIADKVVQILSVNKSVHVSAPEEILLTAGNSYIKINAAGIESGTKGIFVAHASDHSFDGPKTLPFTKVSLPTSSKCLCSAAQSGSPFVEV